MSNDSSDPLGLRPVATAINTAVETTADIARDFINAVCAPAAEELGLALRDEVSRWRQRRVLRMASGAADQVRKRDPNFELRAPPRVVAEILDKGSWSPDELIDAWTGLLATSCSEDGKEDDSLIFIDILSKLTVFQARVLEHVCVRSVVVLTEAGWISSEGVQMSIDEIMDIGHTADAQKVDRELDRLRAEGLLADSFAPHRSDLEVVPTTLALHMHARFRGYFGDPVDYFRKEAQRFVDLRELFARAVKKM